MAGAHHIQTAATQKRSHTSVTASMTGSTCFTASGSAPQNSAVKSASSKPAPLFPNLMRKPPSDRPCRAFCP